MKYIWLIIEDWTGPYLDLDSDLAAERGSGCVVPHVSIEDRPLLWMVVRSQTYYPEHILAYENEKTCHLLVMSSDSFQTDF